MARARSFKPELLIDERLVACSMAARWLYVGMGTEADRAGRLEDRPMRLKLAIFPGDAVEVDPLLNELAQQGLALRYEVAGKRYIQILDWDKLQSPHIKESVSIIPAPTVHGASTGPAPAEPVQAPGEHRASTIPAALTSDSGLLTLDSGPLTSDPSSSADHPSDGPSAGKPKGKGSNKAKEPGKTVATWQAYSEAFERRHGAKPIPNRTANGQLARFVDQVGADESPKVAAFYVGCDDAFYVSNMHPVSLLLRDASKLRTLLVTGRKRSRQTGFDQLDYGETGQQP